MFFFLFNKNESKVWKTRDIQGTISFDGTTKNPILLLQKEDGVPIEFGLCNRNKIIKMVSIQGQLYDLGFTGNEQEPVPVIFFEKLVFL